MSSPKKQSQHRDIPSTNVKVVIRARPVLPREEDHLTLLSVPTPTQVTMTNPKDESSKSFTFDHTFDSISPKNVFYTTQKDIYTTLGSEYLLHTLEGYNTCIFAYGQTGSGKSYTMMGTKEEPGLIPLIVNSLFDTISSAPSQSFSLTISYFEIYNEQVRDLLNDTHAKLKIRESPVDGIYVEGLKEFTVSSLYEIQNYMQIGDKARTTAKTNMNDTSSRSHAVFTLAIKQTQIVGDEEISEKRSSMRLVDLAGSERANATGATGERLKEGSNINKSLATLGRVISILSKGPGAGVVPYRESSLTWLLKENLGGNSKTAMIACVSPCDYDETMSTLRYAETAKKIKTKPAKVAVNESVEMKETISRLQKEVMELVEGSKELEKLTTINHYYEQKLHDAQEQYSMVLQLLHKSRLENMRLSRVINGLVGNINSQEYLSPDMQILREFQELKSLSLENKVCIGTDVEV